MSTQFINWLDGFRHSIRKRPSQKQWQMIVKKFEEECFTSDLSQSPLAKLPAQSTYAAPIWIAPSVAPTPLNPGAQTVGCHGGGQSMGYSGKLPNCS